MTNDEKLALIKDKIKKNRKKAAAREKELKEKLSDLASRILKLSNENYHLKQGIADKIVEREDCESERDELLRAGVISGVEREKLKSVIYKMHEQIQHMYRATVLPDLFMPGGKVIFPPEIMNIQAEWFYTINEELCDVLDSEKFGLNIDQII